MELKLRSGNKKYCDEISQTGDLWFAAEQEYKEK